MMSVDAVAGGACDRSDCTESPKKPKVVRNNIRRRMPMEIFIPAVSCGVGILRNALQARKPGAYSQVIRMILPVGINRRYFQISRREFVMHSCQIRISARTSVVLI